MWPETGAAEGELVRPGNRSQPAGIKTKELYCRVSLLYFFIARGQTHRVLLCPVNKVQTRKTRTELQMFPSIYSAVLDLPSQDQLMAV